MTRELLFVHAPRTGGTSVRHALGLEAHEQHLTAAEHRRRLGEAYDDRFVFAFRRNPWDRAVSIFAFLHRSRPERITPAEFRAWVRRGMVHPSGRPATLYVGRRYAIDVIAEQACWLEGGVGFLGRYERLDADFARVCERMGVEAELPHVNATPRQLPPAAFYDDWTLERVGVVYLRDVRLHGSDGPTATAAAPVWRRRA